MIEKLIDNQPIIDPVEDGLVDVMPTDGTETNVPATEKSTVATIELEPARLFMSQADFRRSRLEGAGVWHSSSAVSPGGYHGS